MSGSQKAAFQKYCEKSLNPPADSRRNRSSSFGDAFRSLLLVEFAMITRQQYIEALSHPDFFVRSGVLRMFSDDRDSGCEVTSAAIASFENFGIREAFEFPHMICDLALDESAAEWALRQVRDLKGEDSNLAFGFLGWIGSKAPIALLRRMLPELKSAAQRKGDFLSFKPPLVRAKLRLELDERPPSECLARLLQVLESCEESESFPHESISEAKCLCRRLVEAEEMRTEMERLTHDWLAYDFSKKFSWHHWRSGIAICLAGLLRIESEIPRVIEHFKQDWDWWNEAIQEAVKRMRTPAALQVCAGIYPTLEWHGRLYLGDVFEAPWVPEIEPIVSQLLKEEPDEDLRVDLAAALALFGTPKSQETARAVLREYPQDPERFIIAETLYYQFILQGIDDPDLKKWRLEMERMHARQKAGTSRFLSSPVISEMSPEIATANKPVQVDFTPGRNDPCPCGSGKKFKKCCLKI